MTRNLILPVGLLLLCGCVKAPQNAAQTITGIEPVAVLVSAQHGLATRGIDVETVDFEKGTLTTAWVNRGPGQVQYSVQVIPRADASVATVVIQVAAQARRKTTDGWSEPAAVTDADLTTLLEQMVEQVVEEYAPGTVAHTTPVHPSCSSAADCTAGTHCASGICVSECSASTDCAEGQLCDAAGRCVPEPPPPCPEPVAEPVEDERPQKAKAAKEGKDAKGKEESKETGEAKGGDR